MVKGFLSAYLDLGDSRRLDLPQHENQAAGQALSDILALLACKEMRVCFSSKLANQSGHGEGDTGAGPGGGATSNCPGAEVAAGALSGMLRKVVCEGVAPVLVQLKGIMEAQRSPFLRPLQRCLCEVLRDFKDELMDVLGGDVQLAKEVAFDMRMGCRINVAMPAASSTVSDPREGALRQEPWDHPAAEESAMPAAVATEPGIQLDASVPRQVSAEQTANDHHEEPRETSGKAAALTHGCVTSSVRRQEGVHADGGILDTVARSRSVRHLSAASAVPNSVETEWQEVVPNEAKTPTKRSARLRRADGRRKPGLIVASPVLTTSRLVAAAEMLSPMLRSPAAASRN